MNFGIFLNSTMNFRRFLVSTRFNSSSITEYQDSKSLIKFKNTKWRLIYKADKKVENMSIMYNKCRMYGKWISKGILFLTSVKIPLFMATEMEAFLFTLGDVEIGVYGILVYSLIYWYCLPGKAILEIYVDETGKSVRFDSNMSAQSSTDRNCIVVPRNKLGAPIEFDQVQAVIPVNTTENIFIGRFPITHDCNIEDRIIFELLFGPFVYNSFQFFKRGEQFGFESVFQKRIRYLEWRFRPSARLFNKIDFWTQLERAQRDLRYQRNSLAQQMTGHTKPNYLYDWNKTKP